MRLREFLLITLISVSIAQGNEGGLGGGGGGAGGLGGGGILQSRKKCYFNGKAYAHDEKIEEICVHLKCDDGEWNSNGTLSSCCDCMSAHNDPHFLTFHGRRFNFHGEGCYTMAQFGRSYNNMNLLLEGIFKKCSYSPKFTCIDAVVYHNSISPVHQRIRIQLDEQGGWETHLNGGHFDVTGNPRPYSTYSKRNFHSKSLIIWESEDCIYVLGSRHDLLKVCIKGVGKKKGIQVIYCVPESFKKENNNNNTIELYGLGGHYSRNSSKADAFVTRNNSRTTDIKEWANSWFSSKSCPPRPPGGSRIESIEDVECSDRTKKESLATCREALKDIPLTDYARTLQEDACVQDLCGFAEAKSSKQDIEDFLVEVRGIASEVGPMIKRQELQLRGLRRPRTKFDKTQPKCGSWKSKLDEADQLTDIPQ